MKEVKFDNTKIAFQNQSTNDLRKAFWLFKGLGSPFLSFIGKHLMQFALRIGLPVDQLIRNTIFKQFIGGETIAQSIIKSNQLFNQFRIGSILDYSVEGKSSESHFDESCHQILATMKEASEAESIPFAVFKFSSIGSLSLLEKIQTKSHLNQSDNKSLQLLLDRCTKISNAAVQLSLPVFIDAEESWIQESIDDITLDLMRKYNQKTAVIYMTIQLYRKDGLESLSRLVNLAKREKFKLGIKLVRGAYMEKERERALAQAYESPILLNKIATDKAFDLAISFCLDHLSLISLCVATHNEKSSLHLIQEMKARKIPSNHPQIFSAQLYGMSDHITYNLIHHQFNVVKYLPFGPIKEVIPYLLRRADENKSIQGQSSRELKLIKKELKRRKQDKS